MEVKILETIPEEWRNKKPLEEYQTTLLYTGYSRYDTKKRTLSRIERGPDDKILYHVSPGMDVLSRVYASESVRIVVYSKSPAVWCEVYELNRFHFFVQQPTQTS